MPTSGLSVMVLWNACIRQFPIPVSEQKLDVPEVFVERFSICWSAELLIVIVSIMTPEFSMSLYTSLMYGAIFSTPSLRSKMYPPCANDPSTYRKTNWDTRSHVGKILHLLISLIASSNRISNDSWIFNVVVRVSDGPLFSSSSVRTKR